MRPLLIAGPTASGKSAYALREAAKGGVVINADASQVYEGWRVLTARPSEEEEAAAPHRLYGHIDPSERHSVGAWLREVQDVLKECADSGLRPIIIGGTGLYFKALTEGLAQIPATEEEVRRVVGERLRSQGLFFLANELKRLDPDTACIIDLNNPMRVLRALEVLEATGKGLAEWREETPPPLVADADKILVTMERDEIYDRCDRRFDRMMEEGALDEAKAMLARGLDPMLPSMKALGAPELFAFINGEMSREDAEHSAKQGTRNFAKRQMTWMRNQMKDWAVAT